MRLTKTFRSAEYALIRERSESLALVWGMGHVFFVVFVALALATSFAVGLAVMIDPEDTRHRAWDAIVSSMGAMLIIAAIGFAVRWYASKKAKRLTDSR
jgi:hypothetical protein